MWLSNEYSFFSVKLLLCKSVDTVKSSSKLLPKFWEQKYILWKLNIVKHGKYEHLQVTRVPIEFLVRILGGCLMT